jgi:hypothetical protein
MLNYFYPPSVRRDFTDREKKLALLSLMLRRTAGGRPQRMAVMGLRRIGKTVLLKEFVARTLAGDAQVWPIYVNCEEITTSPERFALGLIGSSCYWYLRRGERSPAPFFRLETLSTVVKTVLLLLAMDEPLPLAHLARRLKVSPPTALQYLRWLLEVDLIQESADGYCHRDPVLRYWIAHTAAGIELDPYPRRADVTDLLARLDEQFQRASTQLGRAKEAEVRELLRRFDGRRVPGELLGQVGEVTLPRFARVESYRSADGQVELDGLAEADDGTRWAVEVKWRGKAVGRKEVELLAQRAATLGAVPWMISRSGFTPQARRFAASRQMLLSGEEELALLEKLRCGISPPDRDVTA